MMLTFSSTPHAGGREGLQPLSKWLDVVKWEALAAKQVSAELRIASVWSWGWAAFNPAGNDPDKPKVACTWLWTRDHSLCDAPALAGPDLDPSLDVGATLPAGTMCVLGRTRLLASDVAALARLTGDRDVAFTAAFQHAVLENAKPVAAADVVLAERRVIADRFGGSEAAYAAALAKAKLSRGLARTILADEVRREAVERTLGVHAPTAPEVQAWLDTHASTLARAARVNGRLVLVLAPSDRIFALPAGKTATIDGKKVTAVGEPAPLATFPRSLAAPAARVRLVAELADAAFSTWLRRRENQSLQSLACQHDQAPQPDAVDLTDWAPFLSLG
jgi:hypothetical protein